MPSLIMAESGERIALTVGDTVEASEDASTPTIIVDAVMKSLSSSLGASGVMAGNWLIRLEGKVKVSSSSDDCAARQEFPEYSTCAGISKERNQSCSDSATKEWTPVSGCGCPCDEASFYGFDQIGCAQWVSLHNN